MDTLKNMETNKFKIRCRHRSTGGENFNICSIAFSNCPDYEQDAIPFIIKTPIPPDCRMTISILINMAVQKNHSAVVCDEYVVDHSLPSETMNDVNKNQR